MVAIAENILWLLVLIGVMIMIHEFGHFWAARYFDVKVEAFSLGFGPRLFGFRRGETDYRVSAILIGGYVKMAGDAAVLEQVRADSPAALALPEGSSADSRSLLAKPRCQRDPDRPVHVQVSEDLRRGPVRRDRPRRHGLASRSGRDQGRRPHRQARRQAQPHLGGHR